MRTSRMKDVVVDMNETIVGRMFSRFRDAKTGKQPRPTDVVSLTFGYIVTTDGQILDSRGEPYVGLVSAEHLRMARDRRHSVAPCGNQE